MRWYDYVIIRLLIAACMPIIGIVWCIDKVRALFGKESLLKKWTSAW